MTSERFTTILVEQHDHVLTVTLDRPAQRNAFDNPMRRELGELWTGVHGDRSVRCIVLSGGTRTRPCGSGW